MKSGMSYLFQLIQTGKLFEAIEILANSTRNKDADLHRDIIILGGNLRAQQRLESLRLIGPDESIINTNKLTASLLEMTEEVSKRGFLELSAETPETFQPGKKIKILFIASNPKGSPTFELEKEFLEIRKVFKDKREHFEVVENFNTRYEAFFDIVQKEKPDILHIAAPSNDRYLVFHRHDESIRTVPYEFLASPFSLFKDYVKCVFMNTWCAPTFLKQISEQLGVSLGSKNLIGDTDSILFSAGFYSAIAQGLDYKEAFQAGKAVLEKGLPHDVAAAKETYTFFEQGVNLNPEDDTPPGFPENEPEEIRKLRE
jgi:hypothetical protein